MPIFDISFLIVKPGQTGDFFTEWHDCLQQIIFLAKGAQRYILKINVFIHSVDFEDLAKRKQVINNDLLNAFGESCPTFGILPNSPEGSIKITAEISLVKSTGLKIKYCKYKDWRYIIIEKNNCKKLFANGIKEMSQHSDTVIASKNAFEIMNQILQAEGMTFNHVVRQWNYIGDILQTEDTGQRRIQRYQAFNEVRHEYYQRYRTVSGFPAATGIGMNYHGVIIDFIAITPCNSLHIASVFSPHQLNPYAYEQKVLIGDTPSSHGHKHPPMFDRAKLMVCHEKSVVFVSGTASIIGQETVGKGDIQLQLNTTIDNIKALISQENINRNCGQAVNVDLLKYKLIRVYIKNMADFDIVKSICTHHFGDCPAIYLQADICRDDLLVEIEAQLQ